MRQALKQAVNASNGKFVVLQARIILTLLQAPRNLPTWRAVCRVTFMCQKEGATFRGLAEGQSAKRNLTLSGVKFVEYPITS